MSLSLPTEPSYVSPETAASLLRVNLNSVYRALRTSEIPHVRIGREYRIPVEFLGVTAPPVYVRAGTMPVGQLLLDLRW